MQGGRLTRFIRNGNLFNAAIGQPQFKDNYQAWKDLGYQMAIYEWNCPGAASDKWKDMFWIQGEVFLDNLKWLKQNGTQYLCMDQGPQPGLRAGGRLYGHPLAPVVRVGQGHVGLQSQLRGHPDAGLQKAVRPRRRGHVRLL